MNAETWEKIYHDVETVWGTAPDHILLRYAELIPAGQVLDLGMGEGRNAIFFAIHGYPVCGVDLAETAVKSCVERARSMNVPIDAQVGNMLDVEIPAESQSLVMSTNALQFVKQSESQALIARIKSGVKHGGFVYLTMFSTDDPFYIRLKQTSAEIEPNTFYHEYSQQHFHFFEKDEILSQLSDFRLIYFAQETILDSAHAGAPEPHYHGTIVYFGQKE